MSTVPLWDLIRIHFTAIVSNRTIYSCAELVALAPKFQELLRVSQAYVTYFAPLIPPSKSSQVNTYKVLMKAVIHCRHWLGALLVDLRRPIGRANDFFNEAAAAGTGKGDSALAMAAYVDMLRSSELANYALMHIAGWTVHLYLVNQQQQQGKQMKQKQAQQKQRGPTGSAAVFSSSSSGSSSTSINNASTSSTPQVPVTFQDLQLQPDHLSFTGVPGGEKTIAAHAAFYHDELATFSPKARPDATVLGCYLHVHAVACVSVLDQHFTALYAPPAASLQWRAQ